MNACEVSVAHHHKARVIFNAFHHLTPAQAQAFLADAVLHADGVMVVEPLSRSLMSIASCVCGLVFGLIAPLLATRFRWSHLFWTWLVPVIPLALAFDGVVSALRNYSRTEIEAMLKTLPDNDFTWEIREDGPTLFGLSLGKGLLLIGSSQPRRTSCATSSPYTTRGRSSDSNGRMA